jgi:hypothetical protein
MDKQTLHKLLGIACIIIALFIAVSTAQHYQIQRLKDIIEKIDTTTTIKHDTVYQTQTFTDTVPITKYKTITKRDTIYKDSTKHILTLESKTYENTITNDGDTTTYQAHVSGYNLDNQPYPKLDSIKLHTSHQIINTYTETIIEKKVPQKQRKFNVSVGIGSGYGIINKQVDIYAGLIFGYRLWD